MMIKLFVAFVAIAVYTVVVNHSTKTSDASSVETDNFKLPPHIRPISYHVYIDTNLHLPDSGFIGRVVIKVKVESAVEKQIILHSAFLTIKEIEVTDTLNFPAPKFDIELDLSKELLYIKFVKTLSPNQYKIKIFFNGNYDDSGVGFFRNNFTRRDGKIIYFAATNFEGSYARRAFPCFDEPHFKASFEVVITTNENYASQSNTDLKYIQYIFDGTYMEVFQSSSPISTYQVAFVIAQFRVIDRINLAPALPNYRLFGRPEAIAKGEANYAVDILSSIFSAVKNYTKFSDKIERITMIPIPHFRRKCSGNGVSIMYSESILIPNDLINITLQTKQQVFLDVSFGVVQLLFRTISPSAWKYGWLVDGFATFLSYQIGSEDWRLAEQFVERMWYCHEVESKNPITITGETDNRNINENNDIVQLKAGLLLRMLQHVVTAEDFRDGLNDYLFMDMKRASGELRDLYAEIEATANARVRSPLPADINIYNFMKTWETEAGYPVVNFIRDYDTNLMEISQENFHMDGIHLNDQANWYIPITWTTEYDPYFLYTQPTMFLYPQTNAIVHSKATKDQWIIANLQATGYYRVNYDERNWMLITKYWNYPYSLNIHPLNRAQLIDDAFNLARSGRLSYTIAFNLLKCLHLENDYIVHLAYIRVLKFIDKVASWSKSYDIFEEFVGTTFGGALARLGYEESKDYNNHVYNMHRNEVIHWACLMKNRHCRNITSYKLMSDHYAISDNLLFTIACAGLRGATDGRRAWTKINNLSIVPVANKNRTVFKLALGCSEDAITLKYYLDREVKLKNSDVFENIYSKGNYGRTFVLSYIFSYFETIEVNIGDDLGKVLVDFAEHLSIDDHVRKFEGFAIRTSRPNVKKNIEMAIPIIQRNCDLTRVDSDRIVAAIRRVFDITPK